MTDRPDEPAEPADIAEVRRLLAQARHSQPIPADVAARLDDVLADLTRGQGPGSETPAVVVPLASHRRRNVAGMLVAAAVVVGAVVVGPHLSLHSNSGSSATADKAAAGASTPQLGNTGNGQQTVPAPNQHPLTQKLRVRDGRVVVRAGHVAADAAAARTVLRAMEAHPTEQPPCVGVPAAADSVDAEYQRAPAALVYRQVKGTSQVVDLYVCGNSRPVKSVALPAR